MLMTPHLLVALLVAVAACIVNALPSSTGDRILVVLEEAAKPSYSIFLDSLTSRGYTVSYKAPRTPRPALVEHDVLAFDHLIVLSSNARALALDLSPQLLVEYLRLGGNLITALDSSSPDTFRDFAREFSLEFEKEHTALVDHFNTLSSIDSGNHTAVLVGGAKSATGLSRGGLVPNPYVFSATTLSEAKSKPLLYRGLVHRVGANPLAFPLILPPATSYSSETPTLVGEDQDSSEQITSYSTPPPVTITTTQFIDGSTVTSETLSTPRPIPTVLSTKKAPKFGKNGWVAKDRGSLESLDQRKDLIAGGLSRGNDLVSLVSAFQVQSNSARAVFLGSADMLSNAFFQPKSVETVNEQVARDLTAWTFQEKSVLRVANTHHRRVRNDPTDTREDYEENGETGESKMYRIKDTVYYSVDLVAHDPKLGWVPARSAIADLDLQVDFKMLDPYITSRLTPIDKANSSSVSPLDTSPAAATQEDAVTTYHTTFQVPDRHGVFHFALNYQRHGLSFLHKRDTAPVRPFNHDEYPRFLRSSWPYITGACSTALAFVLFCFLWLTTKEDLPKNKKQN